MQWLCKRALQTLLFEYIQVKDILANQNEHKSPDKSWTMRCLSIITFLLMLPIVAWGEDICSVSLRVTEFKPQYYQVSEKEWAGLAVELTKELVKEAGCSLIYKPLPWKRALEYGQEGKVDLVANFSITPERKQFFNFIGPMRDETMVIVVKNDSDYTILNLDDLKRLPGKIGIEDKAHYGKQFDTKYRTDPSFFNMFAPVVRGLLNSRKLVRGRLSGFIEDRYSAVYKIRHDPEYAGFKIQPFFINQDWVYWGVSKESVNHKMFLKLQSAYDRAQAKGRFRAVVKRYQ